MDQQELQETLVEFERGRNQLAGISAQKQQVQLQVEGITETLAELNESKEKTVFKAVGSVLLSKNIADVKKELADQKESLELRLKTVAKQESLLVDKLNKIKSKLEGKAAEAEAKSDKKSKN